MPLWIIYHPEGIFPTSSSKQSLAEAITLFYTSIGLPAFYVVVNFVPLPPSNIFMGGKIPPASRPFVRFVINHVAMHQASATIMTFAAGRMTEMLGPHVEGCDWELHVDETPKELWRINGIVPPPNGSEAEKLWAETNRAVEWEGKET
ncbi:putative oxalocrotonate tautomerase [Schizothecium vesticola]|uniref:Oxalocrotonate tautomerase n=1 Tax=Schizothecium vesticola TaxID=314040 RepID=A0AA40BQW8_9PEZI|nr:putative oxalocrotonate tautomerase [Schizothecium vesticola]